MPNIKSYDVIIVGAGMVGMSMAIALARAGLSIAVIEKHNISTQFEEKFDGRVSAIALGSKHILDNIGVWEFMEAHAEPILDIRVTDGATPFFLHFDHNDVSSDPFGYIVENRYTRHALHLAASSHNNIELIENFTIASLTQTDYNATITGTDDKTLQARLVIAADGRISQARALAGIGITTWSYGQTAIVTTIEHSLPHNGLAQERFFPIGPFAVLPMTGNRSSLVWVEPDDRVNLYLELPEDEFIQEISERIGGYLGDIYSAHGRFSYPLSLLHAKKYTTRRVAVIGDAAHGMHPIAGQGVNLGFRDVSVLADLIIKQHNLGLDIGAENIIADYDNLRKFDNISMLTATDLLNRLFSNNILAMQIARDIGLWTVARIPIVKKLFMKHAMGIKT